MKRLTRFSLSPKKKKRKSVYLVVGRRPWNRTVFDEIISSYPGHWHFISEPKLLTVSRLRDLHPQFVFFLHWSWKVPETIIKRYTCIGFHPTDLPFGRGGSPV